MEDKLFHCFWDTKEAFFARIDECGGWPHNAKSVVLKHVCESNRPCYFSLKEDVRDEWNTSIFTSDDYYWWKISEKQKNKHEKEVIEKIKRMF